MQLACAFSLLTVAISSVTASHLTSRMSTDALDTRDLADTCAFLHEGITIEHLFPEPETLPPLDVCLCISDIPAFITTNFEAINAVNLVSPPVVIASLTSMILANAPNGHCVYPPHATPACIGLNPCGFTCGDGFTPYPETNPVECICPSGSTVCSGICVHGASACPSSAPAKRDIKRWPGSGACNALGAGHVACGVLGGGARAWECVDTVHDLESCGGCMLPLTPYTPKGVDCTAIHGVADVSCVAGACEVRRCLVGYTPSADASRCVRDRSLDATRFGLSTLFYGLEHVPL